MSKVDDWEPGDPLFHAGRWQCGQPMIDIKDDEVSYCGARWSPDIGWRNG